MIAILVTLAFAAQTGPLIAIDPGHGGAHEGAIGPSGTREKDLALEIAKQVAQLCEDQLNAKVALTREADQDLVLAERVAIANKKKAGLFVSIH